MNYIIHEHKFTFFKKLECLECNQYCVISNLVEHNANIKIEMKMKMNTLFILHLLLLYLINPNQFEKTGVVKPSITMVY